MDLSEFVSLLFFTFLCSFSVGYILLRVYEFIRKSLW